MSDKDLVKKAALDALSRTSDEKPKKDKKDKKSVKASASASAPKKDAESTVNSDKKVSEKKTSHNDKLPQKGSAEAAAHNMAAKAASGQASKNGSKSGGFGFLALAILVPVAVIGGLYAFTSSLPDAPEVISKATKNSTPAPAPALTSKSAQKTPPAAPATKADKSEKTTKTATNSTDKTPVTAKPIKTPPKTVATKTSKKASEAKPVAVAKPMAPVKPVAPAKPVAAVKPATPKPVTTKPAVPAIAKTAAKTDKPQWDYKSAKWGSLDPSFKTCGTGKSQSPINIIPGTQQAGPGFQYNYAPSSGKVINTGHGIQVNLDKNEQGKGNQLLVNGKPFDLVQFHFHTPSEHAINGRHAPMEAHLVHKDAQGQLAVVAVMIYSGGSNQLIDHMPVPANKGDFSKSGGPFINPALLLPANRSAFTFTGSLTTPPCTQNVGWVVMQNPLLVSPQTLQKFKKAMGKKQSPSATRK